MADPLESSGEPASSEDPVSREDQVSRGNVVDKKIPQQKTGVSARNQVRTSVLWRAASDLSAAHATYVVATDGNCVDAKLEALLVEDATQINTRLVSESIDVSRFWSVYVQEVATQSSIDDACLKALASAGGNQWNSEQTGGAVTRRLVSARDAFARKFPRLDDQLELRGQPLRTRWDTYGIGLLRQIDQTIWQGDTPDQWWPSRVDGLLVQPIRGGSGNHDCDADRFWMEAVLTDVDPVVSEVLRVAFHVCGIAVDRYVKSVSSESRVQGLWSIASVPIVLSAASELEMISVQPLPIAKAMRMWQVGTDEMAEVVSAWWTRVAGSSDPLVKTVRQLDEMLS